jgi:putative DNA primase/helicase
MLTLLEELSSPIKVFVKECCVLGPKQSIPVSQLYDAYCRWYDKEDGGYPLPVNHFGRDLRAAVPTISGAQTRVGETRIRVFQGIGLG